jgi:hypothetical protein
VPVDLDLLAGDADRQGLGVHQHDFGQVGGRLAGVPKEIV